MGTSVPLEGMLRVYLAPDDGLKRAVRFAVLQAIGSGGKTLHLLPPLRNPEIVTLGNKGMMLAGFKEIDERRLYQGWWTTIAVDRGDWEKAARFASLAADPPEALTTLGILSLRTGQAQEAKPRFAQALQSNPASGRTWLGMGLTQLLSGDHSAAAGQLEHAATFHSIRFSRL